MTWQQFREEWVRLNACKFCDGSHMHTCTLYQCKPAREKAGRYFEKVVAQEEIRAMKRKYVTDLRPWFTESLKMSNIVTAVWLISDEKKKQLVVKFNEELSGMERMAYLRCIGQSLMTLASTEDAKEGGESGFGNLMDMMQLREWRKEDEETIRNGIPHDIGEEENHGIS